MTDTPHLIVTGLGRCGTTMTMAMLDAGGFAVAGPRPSYEDAARFGIGRIDHAWLDRQAGRAVTVVDPSLCGLHRASGCLPGLEMEAVILPVLAERIASGEVLRHG